MTKHKTTSRSLLIPETTNDFVDLFLCHNRADKDWVRRLAEQVESETFDGPPTGRRLRVFFDEWDIDKGENVILLVNEGLVRARFVAVVISPEMLEAPWPTFEWTHVVAEDPTNRRGRLLSLFVRDYSEALQKRAEFPAPFKALNWIDFRKKSEFKKSFRQLITKIRDQRPPRGRQRTPPAPAAPLTPPVDRPQDSPDAVTEIILGNLLPVNSYPQTVWSATTAARQPKEIWEKVIERRRIALLWVHHAAWLSFLGLGDRLYVNVEPSYVFTSDGETPLSGKSVGPLSVQWGGKERNAAILRHIIFWGRTLAGGKIRIELPTGGQPIIISVVPALAQATFGVADDTLGVRSLLDQVEDELDQAARELGEEVLDATSDDAEDENA